MSLDKQKILNDLGSVMNQLQSADCGCLGKMFSNSGNAQNTGAPAFGCQQGGWGKQACGRRPCCGEPFSTNQQGNPMQGNCCMNYCNAPKLYADTYGYLNQNLMQPVIREVYDDLKSISPANTVMNNAMGNQMGLGQGSQNAPLVRGNIGNIVGQNPMGDNMGGMPAGNTMTTMPMGQQQQDPMSGMGAHIVNMMMGSKSKAGGGEQPSQGGDLNSHMGANQGQYAGNIQSMSGYEAKPTEAMGANAAHYNTGNIGATQDQYNYGNMGGNQAQYYAGNVSAQMQKPTVQYTTQPNTMAGNTNQSPRMGNTGGQPMSAAQQGNYGMHSQGVAKFNEMFPGVMEGMGGNLDFDPMSIALQMNPANKQDATMRTMQKLLTGNNNQNRSLDANTAAMKPVINGMNAVNASLTPNQAQPVPDSQVNQQITPNQQQYAVSPQTPVYQQQQVVNPVITEEPAYEEAPLQPVAEQFHQDQPSPRKAGSVNLPEGGYPYQPPPGYRPLVKEPIFPVDTSRTQKYQYNTLGQPIETFPARSYHSAPPGLPQTLSPEPIHTRLRNDPTRYSNVKSTVSKTSLFAGNRAGGKTPSRSQLQHVYNQYKGSQSYTNQNIRNPVQQQPTASDGRLNLQVNPAAKRQIPVERVGGDTIANNQFIPQQVMANKGGQDINQLGDGVANKPQGNADPNGKDRPKSPMKYANLRNGLQDIVFTSPPQTTAWSFHGHTDRLPYTSYRYRNRF